MGLMSLGLWRTNRLDKWQSWPRLFHVLTWEPLRTGAVSLVSASLPQPLGLAQSGRCACVCCLPFRPAFLSSLPFTFLVANQWLLTHVRLSLASPGGGVGWWTGPRSQPLTLLPRQRQDIKGEIEGTFLAIEAWPHPWDSALDGLV